MCLSIDVGNYKNNENKRRVKTIGNSMFYIRWIFNISIMYRYLC